MGGKAKAQKHTAKEINSKIHQAKMAHGGAGGGSKGIEVRKCAKVMMTCDACGQPNFNGVPDIKSHWESKHPKLPFDEAKYRALADANKTATVDALAKRKEVKGEIKTSSKRTL